MEEKINIEIEKIIDEIKNDVEGQQIRNGHITMLSLDNILEKYCTNSMFDSGLQDIFSNDYPDESEEGSYVYYVGKKLIEQKFGIDLIDEGIDLDSIRDILITFNLVNKNNVEDEEGKSYDFEDYCKWDIVVSDIISH